MPIPPGAGAMPPSNPCRRDESGPSLQRGAGSCILAGTESRTEGSEPSPGLQVRSPPEPWRQTDRAGKLLPYVPVPSSPMAGGDREGTPSRSNAASVVAAASGLEGRLCVGMVLEKQTLPVFLHSPGPGESLLMGKENKYVKAQGREGFEGQQGEPAMGSLWLLKIGSFAWGRRSLGDLGDAICLRAHYSILVSTAGTCQGQAPEGTAVPSSPRQSQQPQPGVQSIPSQGSRRLLVTVSIQPGSEAAAPDSSSAPEASSAHKCTVSCLGWNSLRTLLARG